MEIVNELKAIHGIGEKRAERLVDSGIKNMNDLAKKSKEELADLGLNERVIRNVLEYFEDFNVVEVQSDNTKHEEYESQILEWAAEGYYVVPVEEELNDAGDPKKVMDKFGNAVKLSRDMRNKIIDMNVAEHLDEAENLLDMTFDLGKMDQWKDSFEDLVKKIDARDLRYELEDMKIPQLQDRIDAVVSQLKEEMDAESVRDEVEDIKRSYQENFFVEEFIKDSDEKEYRESVQVHHKETKIPSKAMPIDDIFLFHGPKGILLIKWYKHKLSPERGVKGARNIVSDIRNYIRTAKKFKPNMLLKMKAADGTNIILTRGKTLVLAATVSGGMSDYGRKALVNSVNLIEGVDGPILKDWNRKKGEPEYLEKVMKALLLLSLRNRDKGGKR